MKKKQPNSASPTPVRRYQSPNIPMAAIRRYARQIAERFEPEKIILFGSYAHGTPHEDSDVDILVVMPCPDETTQAIRISRAFEHPFSVDLLVRTPRRLQWRLEQGDWFLREVIETGKVLHEKNERRMLSFRRRGR